MIKNNIIAFVATLLALTACVKSIDLTTGDRMVVVECILTEEAPQTLRLDLTTGPTGIEQEALEGAVATLTDLTEQKTAGVFKKADDGLWYLDYAAIPEHKYRLEVEVSGYGTTVSAEDTMPPAVDIYYERHSSLLMDTIVSDKAYFTDYFGHYVEAPSSMLLPNASGGGMIYLIQSVFYSNDSLPEHTLIQGFVYDPDKDMYRVAEMLCADTPGIDNRNLDGNIYESPQRVIRIIANPWSSDSRAHFEGLEKLLLNPKVNGYNCHSRYLKIEREQALSQPFFTISGDFREDQRGFGRTPSSEVLGTEAQEIPWTRGYDYLLFQALSENYNTYLNDAISSSKKSDNLASLYMRESCYTNIEGGVGLFGAVSTQKVPIDMVYSIWELTDDLNKWEVTSDSLDYYGSMTY